MIHRAGEPLPDQLARAIEAIPTVRKLYNLYGPTEDTLYSTCALVERGQRVHLGRPLQPTGPYRLAGLCFGGFVAFEMARQLRAAGEKVSFVLIETYGPVHSPVTSGSRAERVRQLWWHFRRLTITGKAGFIWRRLIRIAGRLLPGRRPPAPSRESPEGLLGGRYSYLSGPYRARPIPGTLDVIRVADQPEWYRRYGGDAPDLGWAGFAVGSVRVAVIPGGRPDLLHEPALPRLAATLRAALELPAAPR